MSTMSSGSDSEKITAHVESDLRDLGITFAMRKKGSIGRLRVCEEQLIWEDGGRGRKKGEKGTAISWEKLIDILKREATEKPKWTKGGKGMMGLQEFVWKDVT